VLQVQPAPQSVNQMPYFLPEGYVERLGAPQSYDIGGDATWQREVYGTAVMLACTFDLHTVVDYGCGSGYKLMQYFSGPEFYTVGIDLAPAVDRLCKEYPQRLWCEPGDLLTVDRERPDLVICSDVIEHVDDPDDLMHRLRALHPKWLVISTPDRKLVEKYPKWGRHLGPPANGCHVREWSFNEFRQYMDQHVDVIRHWITNREQCTQAVIARPIP
jgi:SAM-dependent methyltransferase